MCCILQNKIYKLILYILEINADHTLKKTEFRPRLELAGQLGKVERSSISVKGSLWGRELHFFIAFLPERK